MGWSGAYGDNVVEEVIDRLCIDKDTGKITWSNSDRNWSKAIPGEQAGSGVGRCAISLRSAKIPMMYAAFILLNGYAAKRQLYPVDGNKANTKPENIGIVPENHSYQSWMLHLRNGAPTCVNGIKVISRDDAIGLGLSRYFTGIVCRNGHIAERSVISRACVECGKEFSSRPDQLSKRRENEKLRFASLSKEEKLSARHAAKLWYEKNKDKVMAYRAENADRLRELSAKSIRRRKSEDPVFAMLCHCRTKLCKMLNKYGLKKNASTVDMLGYSPIDLIMRIESQFTDGMGWHNRKDWHIDHICPSSKLIAAGVTDMSIVNHLDNLRPMWSTENIKKSDKIVDKELFDRLVGMMRQR